MPLTLDIDSRVRGVENQPTTVTLRRIRVASLVRWQTFGFFILGMFAGIVYTTSFAVYGRIRGVVLLWYVVLTPFLYAVVGLLSSLVVGLIYNSVAERLGGLEFEVVTTELPLPPPPPDRWEGKLPPILERDVIQNNGA